MPSLLAWLDHDEAARRSALTMIQLFKDEGTVDELGIGSIRDTVADALFPGTSVLHTRARYLLFVPWLIERSAGQGLAPDAAVSDLRRAEVRLIEALLRGGETDGVIGRQARSKLKRMPSAAYWAATYHYGIRRWDTTVEGYFRRSRSLGRLERAAATDEDAAMGEGPGRGVDSDLPSAPADLLQSATFALGPGEGDYLSDRVQMAAAGSLLAWLLENGRSSPADWVWRHPQAGSFPLGLGRIVEHGRRFHTAVHGAVLLYNLLLAERSQRPEPGEAYRLALDEWRAELAAERPFDGWDRDDFWDVLLRRNPRISPLTRRFVDEWLAIVEADDRVEGSGNAARALVWAREVFLKGGRARLVNQSALDAWRGASGLVRLDYRWSVARRLLQDVYDSRPAAA